MSEAVIVAALGFAGTLLGSLFGVLAAQKLTQYRLGQLEEKVNKVNYCTLHVTTDEGSFKALTLRLPGDAEDFPLKVGDRIVKYRGLPFPAVAGCKTPFCVVCGRVDDDGKGTCRTCDSSLIVLPNDPSIH